MEKKQLYRSDHDAVLAGICGGLGDYFNIDPVIIRIICLLVILFTGVFPGVLAYIIAIFIIPKELTTNRQ